MGDILRHNVDSHFIVIIRLDLTQNRKDSPGANADVIVVGVLPAAVLPTVVLLAAVLPAAVLPVGVMSIHAVVLRIASQISNEFSGLTSPLS